MSNQSYFNFDQMIEDIRIMLPASRIREIRIRLQKKFPTRYNSPGKILTSPSVSQAIARWRSDAANGLRHDTIHHVTTSIAGCHADKYFVRAIDGSGRYNNKEKIHLRNGGIVTARRVTRQCANARIAIVALAESSSSSPASPFFKLLLSYFQQLVFLHILQRCL